MVCPSCGASNSEQTKTCGQCGRGLIVSTDDLKTLYLDESTSKVPVARGATGAAAAGGPGAMTWGSLPSQAIAMPSVIPAGTMFGRYRIENLLGEGGMGAVYKAYDTELDRTVALKLVRPELAISEQTMKRFKQELLLASKISHKNILRIHDLGDAGGIKFITMAFVEGKDLAHLIDRTGPLPLDRALKFSRQLCGALEAAHDEGVVHRDLKPQNVLVDGSDNIYVSDFGLAKSLEAEISMGTRTGQILGTPRYMSPEQVEARDVDHRSDLYSAGLIIYEMFTGELPFRGESAMQLMYQRVSEPPRDPRRARADLPEYLANIILKCLEKDPAKRYQSAREILTDIDAQNAPVVTNAGGKTISIQLRRPSRRGAFIGLGVTTVLLGALVTIPQTRNAIRGVFGGGKEIAPTQKIEHYIAVAPVSTTDDRLKYIAEAIGDSLTAKLSGLHNVYVADSSAVNASPEDVRADDAKLAKALGVKLIIRAALLASGDRIALTVKVQDTEVNKSRLTKPFEGVKQDLLTLQDQVFEEVANALLIRQTDEERLRTGRPTQDVTAYDLYLRGASLIRARRDAKTGGEALALFEKAANQDPQFALAYAGIADASMAIWRQTKEEELTQRATSAAEQAERLNTKLAQVHYSLGTVYSLTGKTAEAVSEAKRALELAPNSDEGLRRLGAAYRVAGQQSEALAAFEEAVRINRYYWNNHNQLGGMYLRLGENEKALAAFQEVVKLAPDNPKGRANLGLAYYSLGNWSQAIVEFEKSMQLDASSFTANLGVAYFFLGRYPEAAKVFERALEKSPDDAGIALSLADTYRWSNQADKAGKMYGRAIESALRTLKIQKRDTEALAVLAMASAQKGKPEDALRYVRQARQIDPKTNQLMYREATVHTLARRWPEALSSLQEALQNGYSLKEAQADPDLKELREKPEFPTLLQEVSKRSVK